MEESADNRELIRYLEGSLTSAERLTLQARLEKEPQLKAELLVLQELYAAFELVRPEAVPTSLDQRFYHFLEQAQKAQAAPPMRSRFPYWKWVAVAACLLMISTLGISLYVNGTQQQQLANLQAEMDKTQKMLILSMLENPSASDRMQAVAVSSQQTRQDDEILQALQQVLDYDPNVNVRLKAASSLADFVEEPNVIKILIASLEKQSHPQVQIALIEILTAARKREALGAFQELLQQQDLMEIVKDKAAEGIGILL